MHTAVTVLFTMLVCINPPRTSVLCSSDI